MTYCHGISYNAEHLLTGNRSGDFSVLASSVAMDAQSQRVSPCFTCRCVLAEKADTILPVDFRLSFNCDTMYAVC